MAGDLLALQFERFTNKVKKLNFVYGNRIYYTNPTEWRFRVLQLTDLER